MRFFFLVLSFLGLVAWTWPWSNKEKGVEKIESAEKPSEAAWSPDPKVVKDLCSQIQEKFKKQSWGESGCDKIQWKTFGESQQGRPLLYFEAGQSGAKKLTLIQCGIHGDELPTVPMCFRFIDEVLRKVRVVPADMRLIVQPLLNPDGFLATRPTRNNSRGVDINRNFPTRDWAAEAEKNWKFRAASDPRKFPGKESNSESETQALVRIIDSWKPQKIISLHTPLGHLDLDAAGSEDQKRRAKYLAINMSLNSGRYDFKSYGYFPGSLGNYAGHERKIPVYTLELPPGNAKTTIDQYWTRFRLALWRAVEFDLESGKFLEND